MYAIRNKQVGLGMIEENLLAVNFEEGGSYKGM